MDIELAITFQEKDHELCSMCNSAKISQQKRSENNVENIKVPLYKLTAYPCLEYYIEFFYHKNEMKEVEKGIECELN